MANTYTQIYIHIVFAVKHRDAQKFAGVERPGLHKYINGNRAEQGTKIDCHQYQWPNHAHIL